MGEPRGAWLLALGVHGLLLSLPLAVAGALGAFAPSAALALWLGLALALQLGERLAAGARLDLPPEDPLDARLALATGLLLLATQWAAAGEALFVHEGRSAPLAACGGALALAGLLLRCGAIRALGRDFVSGLEGRARAELCERGLYAISRHPSELGLLAFACGSALLLESALALGLVLAGLLPLVLVRSRREERALRARFPGYAAYARRVGWLGLPHSDRHSR